MTIIPDPPIDLKITRAHPENSGLHTLSSPAVFDRVDVSWTPASDPYLGPSVPMTYQWSVVVSKDGGLDGHLFPWMEISAETLGFTARLVSVSYPNFTQ